MCLSFFSAGETVKDTTSPQGVLEKEEKRAEMFHRRSEVCSRAKQRENEMFVEQSTRRRAMSSGGVFLGGRNRRRHKQSPRRTAKGEKRNGNVSSARRGPVRKGIGSK